jgi:predicted phosphodiesterase
LFLLQAEEQVDVVTHGHTQVQVAEEQDNLLKDG